MTIGQGGAAPAAGGRGAATPAATNLPGATAIQQLLVGSLTTDTAAQVQALAAARTALTAASFTADAATIAARAAAVGQAEEALALARAGGFARIQSSVARLSPAQVTALAAQAANPAAPAAAAAGRGGAAGGRGGAATPADQARLSILNSPKLDEVYPVLIEEAAKLNGDSSQLADAALLNIAARRFGAAAPREAATRALDAGWASPARRLQIILAAVTAGDTTRAPQIIAAASDSDAAISRAATFAMQQLAIDPAALAAAAAAPKVGTMTTDAVIAAVVSARGSVARGAQLVKELGCTACHTVSPNESPKGPPLNLVSKILARRELAEAILLPNKSMAQGFPTNQITRRSGGTVTGFVVQETPAAITLQDITTQQTRIPVSDIANRTSLEISIMPQGLTGNLSVTEFASLLDYIESLGR
jgi:putative heme-binding domain-containing protein